MKKFVKIAVSVLIMLAAVVGGFQVFKAGTVSLSEYLPESYRAYEFPRADMGPGTVFVGINEGGSVKIEKVICDNLYLATDPVRDTATIALPNIDGTSDRSANGVFDFFSGAFGTNFDAKQNNAFSVQWGNVYISKLGSEVAFLEDGSERNITAACNSRIDQFSDIIGNVDGEQTEKVYIITSTIASDNLTLTYSRNGAFSTEGQIELLISEGSEAQQKATVNFSDSERSEISFNQTMFLGYETPWEIVEWLPSSLTGSALASIRARPIE